MKRLAILMILFSFIIVLPACSDGAEKGKQAPNFSLKAQDGKTVELAKLKGKVVVVNFWATWCGPCKMEIPGFLDVYGKYRSKGLEIVGISLDEQGWDVVKPYVTKANITYPVVIGNAAVAQSYGKIDAIPTTFIVDKSGNIVDQHIGYMSKDQFEAKIKPLL